MYTLILCLFLATVVPKKANCNEKIWMAPPMKILESSADAASFACLTHNNCTVRVFSLRTYCCLATKSCCNWFEFTSTYKSNSSVGYRAPSLLTIILILIFIVCLLFLTYCFGIVFCFCFKCGLFKRPKVVVLSALPRSGTDSGLISAENASPKHSASTSSSTSSSNSAAFYPNRRRAAKKPRKKFNSANQGARNPRSPTARAFSNYSQPQRQFAETEVYFDYDNDSPFLIPANGRASNRGHRFSTTTDVTRPSAPPHELNTLLRHSNQVRNMETIAGSTSSLETSSSLGFGASLIEAIERADLQQPQDPPPTTNNNAINTLPQTTYYQDEKPPSYDDIIRRNY